MSQASSEIVFAAPTQSEGEQPSKPAAAGADVESDGGAHSLVALGLAVLLGLISFTLRLVFLVPFMGLRAALRYPWAPRSAAAAEASHPDSSALQNRSESPPCMQPQA